MNTTARLMLHNLASATKSIIAILVIFALVTLAMFGIGFLAGSVAEGYEFARGVL